MPLFLIIFGGFLTFASYNNDVDINISVLKKMLDNKSFRIMLLTIAVFLLLIKYAPKHSEYPAYLLTFIALAMTLRKKEVK